MPHSLQDVLDHADELAQRFTDNDPDMRDAAPLRAIREGVTARAEGEQRIVQAVGQARTAGVP